MGKATWTPSDEIACLRQQAEQYLKAECEKAFRAGFLAATEKAVRVAVEGTCQSMRKTADSWDCPSSLVLGFADLMERELPKILAALCADALKAKAGEAK